MSKEDLKNKLPSQELQYDDPIVISRPVINDLLEIVGSLVEDSLVSDSTIVTEKTDWDSLNLGTINTFTSLSGNGAPSKTLTKSDEGLVITLGSESKKYQIVITDSRLLLRVIGETWNPLSGGTNADIDTSNFVDFTTFRSFQQEVSADYVDKVSNSDSLNKLQSAIKNDVVSKDDFNSYSDSINNYLGDLKNDVTEGYEDADTKLDQTLRKDLEDYAHFNLVAELTDNDDLLSLTKPGWYKIPGTNPKNNPWNAQMWGFLHKTDYEMILHDNVGNLYIRSNYDNKWKQFINADDVNNKISAAVNDTKNYVNDVTMWRASDNPKQDSINNPQYVYYKKEE